MKRIVVIAYTGKLVLTASRIKDIKLIKSHNEARLKAGKIFILILLLLFFFVAFMQAL